MSVQESRIRHPGEMPPRELKARTQPSRSTGTSNALKGAEQCARGVLTQTRQSCPRQTPLRRVPVRRPGPTQPREFPHRTGIDLGLTNMRTSATTQLTRTSCGRAKNGSRSCAPRITARRPETNHVSSLSGAPVTSRDAATSSPNWTHTTSSRQRRLKRPASRRECRLREMGGQVSIATESSRSGPDSTCERSTESSDFVHAVNPGPEGRRQNTQPAARARARRRVDRRTWSRPGGRGTMPQCRARPTIAQPR
jgi:hypothetical protein